MFFNSRALLSFVRFSFVRYDLLCHLRHRILLMDSTLFTFPFPQPLPYFDAYTCINTSRFISFPTPSGPSWEGKGDATAVPEACPKELITFDLRKFCDKTAAATHLNTHHSHTSFTASIKFQNSRFVLSPWPLNTQCNTSGTIANSKPLLKLSLNILSTACANSPSTVYGAASRGSGSRFVVSLNLNCVCGSEYSHRRYHRGRMTTIQQWMPKKEEGFDKTYFKRLIDRMGLWKYRLKISLVACSTRVGIYITSSLDEVDPIHINATPLPNHYQVRYFAKEGKELQSQPLQLDGLAIPWRSIYKAINMVYLMDLASL
ncbi:uncharacterized protein BDR25DRAFT_362467 [Lindgomyces ingoldianus]|uniref:Uncharacterized protein n=1 Tax=Lindgomyces ingoldianus TaxID=673940 RepID=A0ACB6QCE5_9PLEO|nr:uncharacterized protein BDR25DRAFT_362467 [Lindgomyces ingoldianus]KAF2463792.1 hypothetical protein BDR25DRAFT_362467 [Lindgomyces ingoldianus]